MSRSLRSTDTLRAWVSDTERRISRLERRGQTTGVAVPGALLAVATVGDIPEGADPETTTVYVVESGETLNFDQATRRWTASP